MTRRFLAAAAPASLFMAAFFVVPCGVLFAYSFGEASYVEVSFGTSLANYAEVLGRPLYRELILRSLWMGGTVGVATVVLAFPLAYAITLGPYQRYGTAVLLTVVISLFTAYIVRIYAWRTLLGRSGALNEALLTLGLIDKPLEFLLYSQFALIVTLTSVLIPVAILPLSSALAGVPRSQIEAARNLGASAWGAFLRVTIPLANRGIVSAFALTFVITAGDFVTPQLVGSPNAQLAGNAVVSRFGLSFDWPLGSALAFSLVVAIGAILWMVMAVLRLVGVKDRP